MEEGKGKEGAYRFLFSYFRGDVGLRPTDDVNEVCTPTPGLAKLLKLLTNHQNGIPIQPPESYISRVKERGYTGRIREIQMDPHMLDAHYLMGYLQGYLEDASDIETLLNHMKCICGCLMCK